MSRGLTHREPLGIEHALSAIACFPRLEDAVQHLEANGYKTTVLQLENMKHAQADRVQEIRQEHAPRLEALLADDMLDNARLAGFAERIALEATIDRLQTGKANDPSRVARDISQVKTQSIDKRLALQGRPSQVIETRDVAELVRALVGLGVAEVVDSGASALDVPDAEIVSS